MLRKILRAFPPFSGSRTLRLHARPRADATRRRAAARRLPASPRLAALRGCWFTLPLARRTASAGSQVVRAVAVPARIGVGRRARRCRALHRCAAPRSEVVHWAWVPTPVAILLRGTFGRPLHPSQPRPRARLASLPLPPASALTLPACAASLPSPLTLALTYSARTVAAAAALLSPLPAAVPAPALAIAAAVATCLLLPGSCWSGPLRRS